MSYPNLKASAFIALKNKTLKCQFSTTPLMTLRSLLKEIYFSTINAMHNAFIVLCKNGMLS